MNSDGRYLAQEPMAVQPDFVVREASEGRPTPAYCYAGANPISQVDPTGLYRRIGGACNNLPTADEAKKGAKAITDECLRKCVVEMLDSDAYLVQCHDPDPFSELAGNARLSAFCGIRPNALARTATATSCSVRRAGVTQWCDREVPKACQIEALVHEAAHACGWDEAQKEKKGVPGPNGELSCGGGH